MSADQLLRLRPAICRRRCSCLPCTVVIIAVLTAAPVSRSVERLPRSRRRRERPRRGCSIGATCSGPLAWACVTRRATRAGRASAGPLPPGGTGVGRGPWLADVLRTSLRDDHGGALRCRDVGDAALPCKGDNDVGAASAATGRRSSRLPTYPALSRLPVVAPSRTARVRRGLLRDRLLRPGPIPLSPQRVRVAHEPGAERGSGGHLSG